MTDEIDPISLQCADIVTDLYADKHGPFFEAAHKVANLVEGLEAKLQAARAEVERLRSRVAVLERVQESASLLAAAKAKFDSLVNESQSAYDAVLNGDYTAPNLSDLQQEVNNAEKEQDDAMDAVVQAALDAAKETP